MPFDISALTNLAQTISMASAITNHPIGRILIGALGEDGIDNIAAHEKGRIEGENLDTFDAISNFDSLARIVATLSVGEVTAYIIEFDPDNDEDADTTRYVIVAANDDMFDEKVDHIVIGVVNTLSRAMELMTKAVMDEDFFEERRLEAIERAEEADEGESDEDGDDSDDDDVETDEEDEEEEDGEKEV